MKKIALSLMAAMIILTPCSQGEAKTTTEVKPPLESIMVVMVKQGQEYKRLEQEKLKKEKQEQQAKIQAEKLTREKTGQERKIKEISVCSVGSVNVPLDDGLVAFIFEHAKANNIDPYLILGMIKTESNFDESLSHHNSNGTTDHGLLQINDVVLDDMAKKIKDSGLVEGEVDPYNPYHNVLMSIEELKMCREYWEDTYSGKDLEFMCVLSYNRGRVGAKRFIENNGLVDSAYTKKVYKAKIEIMNGGER